ncbi:hypothetical protein [Bacillus sp. SRB_331]|uniref:hypothetical protein n=1 Tax=Bacillus sp. SRB_331 TaxID=1969379 RepID=UPI00115999C0|nr:hypothetical protein [Bacillus sp. SRB_331]
MMDSNLKRCVLLIQQNKLNNFFFAFSITDVENDTYKAWKTEITLSGNISNERLVTDFENHFWNPIEGTLFIGLQKNMLSVKLIQIYNQYTEDEVFLIPLQDLSYATSLVKLKWEMYLVEVSFYNNQGIVVHKREINTGIYKGNSQAKESLYKFFLEINSVLDKWKTLLEKGEYCDERQIYIV